MMLRCIISCANAAPSLVRGLNGSRAVINLFSTSVDSKEEHEHSKKKAEFASKVSDFPTPIFNCKDNWNRKLNIYLPSSHMIHASPAYIRYRADSRIEERC